MKKYIGEFYEDERAETVIKDNNGSVMSGTEEKGKLHNIK